MNMQPYVIVVGLDYSELSDAALARAFELASREPAADVHVISVLPPAHADASSIVAKATLLDGEIASCRLKDYVEMKLRDFSSVHAIGARGASVPGSVVSHVRFDAPASGIAQLA